MTKTIQINGIFSQKADLERVPDYGKWLYCFWKDKPWCDLSCFLCLPYNDFTRTVVLEVLLSQVSAESCWLMAVLWLSAEAAEFGQSRGWTREKTTLYGTAVTALWHRRARICVLGLWLAVNIQVVLLTPLRPVYRCLEMITFALLRQMVDEMENGFSGSFPLLSQVLEHKCFEMQTEEVPGLSCLCAASEAEM